MQRPSLLPLSAQALCLLIAITLQTHRASSATRLSEQSATRLSEQSATRLSEQSATRLSEQSATRSAEPVAQLTTPAGASAHTEGAVSNSESRLIAETDASAFSIVLDPGHGGRDHGATHGNLKESEIALKVATKLEKLLRADPNFRVSMTRKSDQTLTLEERTLFAKREHADLYLSIHLNSSTDSHAQGKEFYFQNQLPVDEDSMFLASRENDSATPEPGTHEPRGPIAQNENDPVSKRGDIRNIIDDLKRNERIHSSSLLSKILFETWVTQPNSNSNRLRHSGSRAIRQAPFFVIANSDSPAVLVELGFITHPIEGPRLVQASYQDDLAQSLYDGIVKFRTSYSGAITHRPAEPR